MFSKHAVRQTDLAQQTHKNEKLSSNFAGQAKPWRVVLIPVEADRTRPGFRHFLVFAWK